MPEERDTIVALSTAPGAAAVSVVRISGSLTPQILSRLVSRKKALVRNPRKLILCSIFDVTSSEQPGQEIASSPRVLDSALVAYFPAPRSFTGEASAEFQLHGSTFIVERFIKNVIHCGARIAKPGEFTERAFLNGRMDLTQAEAVCDLIAAETELQATHATKQLSGRLSSTISTLGEPLRDLLAEIEAHIDFPEEDIQPKSYDHWSAVLTSVQHEISLILATYKTGRICREGALVAIVGRPNAGKSSLLNTLAREDRAIVTPIAGTTRDFIEERISLRGLSVKLVDTAGLVPFGSNHTPDPIEALGIERSWRMVQQADLVLYVVDSSSVSEEDMRIVQNETFYGKQFLLLANKQDLLEHTANSLPQALRNLQAALPKNTPLIHCSTLTKTGIEQLENTIFEALLGKSSQTATSSLTITTRRHHTVLVQTAELLTQAASAVSRKLSPEFIALDIRASLGALQEIVGITTTDEILGRIFSKFCIGK